MTRQRRRRQPLPTPSHLTFYSIQAPRPPVPFHDARELHRRRGPCGRVVLAAPDAAARIVSPALPRRPRIGTHRLVRLRLFVAARRSRLRCRPATKSLTSGLRRCLWRSNLWRGGYRSSPSRCFAATGHVRYHSVAVWCLVSKITFFHSFICLFITPTNYWSGITCDSTFWCSVSL